MQSGLSILHVHKNPTRGIVLFALSGLSGGFVFLLFSGNVNSYVNHVCFGWGGGGRS